MKSLAAYRWLLTRTGMLYVLVAGALAAPATAHASCGDYVTVMPVQNGTHSNHEPNNNVTPHLPSPQSPRDVRPGHRSPGPQPRPCPGPSCSRFPPVSPPMTASTNTVQAERWAKLGESLLPE